jgi:BlaR1 peptidase M56/TonB-dependent Receptor Plug Domain
MTPLFSYFFQASLVTAAFLLFYKLLLRRDTFFKWSRSYFLVAVNCSFAFPFIDVSYLFQNTAPLVLIEYIPNLSFADLQTAKATDYWQLLISSLLYSGIAIMFIRLMMQMMALKKLRKNKIVTHQEKVKIVLLDEQVNPFSFFNEIYINPSLHSDKELEEIIKHEQFHIEQNHTLDILLGEILTIVFWFNPFAWLLKNEMKQNLEFLTDKLVLQSGIDAKHYQYNLLKVSGLQNNIAAANHFHFLKLKNRIMMMNKKQTNPFHAIKFLLLVPVVALLLMAFSERKQIIQTFNEAVLHDTMPPPPPPPIESKVTVANAPSTVDKVTITTSDNPNNDSKLPKNVKQVEIVRKGSKKEVTVTLRNGTKELYNFNKEEDQVNFEKKYGKIAEVVPLPPPPPPPGKAEAPVVVTAAVDPAAPTATTSPVVATTITGTGTYTTKKPATLNNKGYYLSIADDDGECVVIVKNKDKKIVEAVKLTDWDKAKEVYEKKYGPIPPATPKVTALAPTTNASKGGPAHPYTTAGVTFKTTQAQTSSNKFSPQVTDALVIVDGIKQNNGTDFNLNSIDPNTIASISILKDKAAIDAYGDEGKQGVIIIKTKKKEPTTTITGTITDPRPKPNTPVADPLYVVDGKIRTKEEIKNIQPASIESVNILKGEQAITEYGDKGKNGVVVIVLKK